MDITDLILTDHHEQRRMFALLDEVDRADRASASRLWQRLRVLLEVHAEAEERILYPQLLRMATAAAAESSTGDPARDALYDHNDLRDAIVDLDEQEEGSPSWWNALAAVREANSDHMGEQECGALAHVRHRASRELRHALGVRFATFESADARGVGPRSTYQDAVLEDATSVQG